MAAQSTTTEQTGRHMRTRREKRRWIQVVEFTVTLAMLAGLGYGFYGYITEKSAFGIKQVRFEGANVLTDQQMLEAAQIKDTDTLLSVHPDQVRQRMLDLPYVNTCEVTRAVPDTVIVRITERIPVASVMANNHIYEIDHEGRVLREVPPLSKPNGPLITNLPEVQSLTPGQNLKNNVMRRALELWAAFSASPVAQQLTLSEISAEGNNMLFMFFDELPFETRWGRSDFEAQVRRFEILWREKQGKLPCTEYLDMRFDNDVVCK